ncbi:MAG TPA: hypothetical protein VGB03_03620, partial [Acidimicrobiales bacterium]
MRSGTWDVEVRGNSVVSHAGSAGTGPTASVQRLTYSQEELPTSPNWSWRVPIATVLRPVASTTNATLVI